MNWQINRCLLGCIFLLGANVYSLLKYMLFWNSFSKDCITCFSFLHPPVYSHIKAECVCVCVCVCAHALPQHIRCAPTHISVRVLLLSHHRGWFTLVSQARLCLLGVIVPWFFISLALCLVPSTWQELSSFIHFFINICYSYALCWVLGRQWQAKPELSLPSWAE